MRKHRISRRQFLDAAAATGAAIAAPYVVPASALGKEPGKPAPSERVTLAGVGCGGRGSYDLDRLVRYGGQVVAVCDVNKESKGYWNDAPGGRDVAKKIAEAEYARQTPSGTYGGIDVYEDYREVLARPDIDAVGL